MASYLAEAKRIAKENDIDFDAIWKELHDDYEHVIRGGSLQSKDLKKILSSTYDKKNKDIGDFKVDKSLSGRRAKVYHNENTGQTVVSHRGTASLKDWGTDLGMSMGYENGNRFKHAEKVQKQL